MLKHLDSRFRCLQGVLQYHKENYVVWKEVKFSSCFIKHVLGTYRNMEVKIHAFVVLLWIEMNDLASHTTFSQRKYFWLPLDGTLDWYLKLVWRLMPCVVGPCHHGMARPQVVDRGNASFMEGSCE